MQIFGDSNSGNCLKVKYTCDHLGLPYRWEEVDVASGATRAPSFLEQNPQGQVPFVVLDDGRPLAQSNAIIWHLAEQSPLVPDDGYARARVLELLFWEQYSHEPYIAVCRYNLVYQGKRPEDREPWRVQRGERALDLLDAMLDDREWLVGGTMTVADVSLVAYTRLAPEGGFDLGSRPHVRAWIGRVEAALGLRPVEARA